MTGPGSSAAPLPAAADDSRQQLANLRDLGGLRLAAGGVTRAGVLYRSDAPYPGDDVPDGVPAWPPATVIDLRSPGETESRYCWPAGVSVHRVPLMRRAAVVSGGGGGTALELPGSLEVLYLRMLETVAGRLASFVAIAAASPAPTLVHCSAGKDRTGVVIALLLLTAGVEPEDVVTDYTTTAQNMSTLLGRLRGLGRQLPVDLDPGSELLGAPAKAITAVTERLIAWPSGAQAWVQAHGASAADVERWQDQLAGAGR